MGLTATQLAHLRAADQRFRARVGVFPAYTPTITYTPPNNATGTALTPFPMPMVSPRLSMVDNGGAITLYATDSYNRGGAYVGNGNVAWVNTGGAGTLVDNADGTATYTAPGVGSGTNAITMTATNANGSSAAICYVQYPNTTNDAIVADVATISGSVEQHGWTMLLRLAGSASAFTIGSRVLLHVEDTWYSTTSTFGGYKYAEGVFSGYIKEIEYFEDAFGQTFVGVECVSLWWLLDRLKMGETWWGQSPAGGRFYLSGFAPVDAIWHFVTKITDVSKYHNVTMWFDRNLVDDLIIEESNLSTIIEDCMARTLATAWTDRYGSLMCIPDPDVRAGEWWGTPAPVFDSGGDGPLTANYVSDYTITYHPYKVRKLSMQALDWSLLGIWAISVNTASSLGEVIQWPGKLLCDTPTALAGWVAQMRAKYNRKWSMNVTRYLDHTVDMMNFVDVNFTSPSQTNGLTASGRTWVNSISYRPNIFDGGWIGNWELLKQTSGDVDGSSAWGGTGANWGNIPEWPGTAPSGGGWGNNVGGITSFCHTFDFVNSGLQGWTFTPTYQTGFYDGVPGTVGAGGLAGVVLETATVGTGEWIVIENSFPARPNLSITLYTSAPSAGNGNRINMNASSTGVGIANFVDQPFTSGEKSWAGSPGAGPVDYLYIGAAQTFDAGGFPGTFYFKSAIICGSGTDPF